MKSSSINYVAPCGCVFDLFVVCFFFIVLAGGPRTSCSVANERIVSMLTEPPVYSTTLRTFPIAMVLFSSRSVKRPIWGKSLNCSKHINPEHSILIMAT